MWPPPCFQGGGTQQRNTTVTREGFEPPAISLGRSSSFLLSYRAVDAETGVEPAYLVLQTSA